MNLRKKTIHTNSLKREDTKDNDILLLTKQTKNGPMKLRDEYISAVMMKNRLHHESGEPIEEAIHPGQQRRIHQGQEVSSEDYLSSARVDQHTGWQYWLSSPIPSWWYASEWSWKWAHIFFFARISFCYSWFRLQLIKIHCNRRECEQNILTQRMVLQHVSCKKSASSTCHHVSDCALSLHPLISSFLSSVSTSCPISPPPLCWSSPRGRNRRVLNPMRTHRMRSIAPWWYTTLSHLD